MKKMIFMFTMFALIGLTLTACSESAPSEPAALPDSIPPEASPSPTPELSPSPTPELNPSPTPEPEGSVLLFDLVGFWLLSHATDETGAVVEVTYSDWLTHAIEIREDGSFSWHAYGALFGDLIYARDNHFTAVNLVATSEGETWYPDKDEVTISYDPETGLLRHTRVFGYPFDQIDIQHQYFVRTDVPPWSIYD